MTRIDMKTQSALAILAASLFSLPTARAATINAPTCSQANVQSAVNAAQDGDTVSVPAGSCAWSSAVSWTNKNVKVIGAGIGNTVITPANGAFSVTATTKGAFRISGMTISGAPSGNPFIFYLQSSGTETPIKGWRIDHIRFNFTNSSSLRAFYISGISWGLIDHCIFDGNEYIGVESAAYTDAEYNRRDVMGSKSWSLPINLGSDEAIYIEDSTWNLTGKSIPGINDMVYGARQVFRHNTVSGAWFQTHAARSNDRGGGLKYEIYNNTFKGNGFIWPLTLRSGTGVVFNNTISGYSINSILMDNQRTFESQTIFPPLGQCNGSSSFDGNKGTGNEVGWPCIDQIGRGPGAIRSQPGVPLYAWNNGSLASCATGGACNNTSLLTVNNDGINASGGSGHPWNSDHIRASAHFNGEVDYVNNGSNGKVGYSPYVYPHPLQGASPPPAAQLNPPLRLRVIP
jgi:hypothetical protein